MQPYKPMEEEGSPTEGAPQGGQPATAQPLTVASPPRQVPSNQVRLMMTSSNENIFRVTGPLCREFTGPGESPLKAQWRGTLMFSVICVWINSWVNNREAGDLRRYRGHYDVSVMRDHKRESGIEKIYSTCNWQKDTFSFYCIYWCGL